MACPLPHIPLPLLYSSPAYSTYSPLLGHDRWSHVGWRVTHWRATVNKRILDYTKPISISKTSYKAIYDLQFMSGGSCWACSTMWRTLRGNKSMLLNWAMQKSRAFQIKLVAEPTLNIYAQFTPPMLIFKWFCYLEHTHIYYALLLL